MNNYIKTKTITERLGITLRQVLQDKGRGEIRRNPSYPWRPEKLRRRVKEKQEKKKLT